MRPQEYLDKVNALRELGIPLADIIDMIDRMETLDKRHTPKLTASARKQATQSMRIY